jgi:hypothetical protein
VSSKKVFVKHRVADVAEYMQLVRFILSTAEVLNIKS